MGQPFLYSTHLSPSIHSAILTVCLFVCPASLFSLIYSLIQAPQSNLPVFMAGIPPFLSTFNPSPFQLTYEKSEKWKKTGNS